MRSMKIFLQEVRDNIKISSITLIYEHLRIFLSVSSAVLEAFKAKLISQEDN